MGTTAGNRVQLPTGDDLLTREGLARSQGTHLVQADLLGEWRLQRVWSKGSRHVDALSSTLLQRLAARLVISAQPLCPDVLAVANAVDLAGLTLCFEGQGRLIGKRPLLQFSFNSLQLHLGNRVLLKRSLPPVTDKRIPFFALIGRDPSGWLAARGRGGGLALWQLAP